MSGLASFFGTVSNRILQYGNSLSPGARDAVVIFGALGMVALVTVIWAAYFRKKPRERKRRGHRSGGMALAVSVPKATEPAPAGGDRVRRKWRRSRGSHRPRNPTLAETRGLPPLRDAGTPPQGL